MNSINEERIIRNIQKLGERFCQEMLRSLGGNLEENWWEGLKFFFGHTFFRGRRDQLSAKYYQFTIQALQTHFNISNENLMNAYNRLISATEDKIEEILQEPREVEINWESNTYTKELCLNNEKDRKMVLAVLNFMRKIKEVNKNVYQYLKNRISQGEIKKVYEELKDLYGIGDKIACLIIRDILLLNPEINIKKENYKYAFPVDTWVRKVANKLGVSDNDDERIKESLINKCDELKVDPLKVAAGLWYLGVNSLNIALELLERIEI